MDVAKRYWLPLALDDHIERDFAAFRERELSGRLACNETLLDKTVAKLTETMRPHIAEIVGRDGLPHLAHAIVGWGDAQFEELRLTDRITAFVTGGPTGPQVPQCDPEGDFHPWQSFAYAAMAGAEGERALGSSSHSLCSLVRHSRVLQTSEGRELGHLLFALAEYDPDIDGRPFLMAHDKVDVRELPEIAIHAHHFGTLEVCRKFHLTEGLCAATARVPGFERYRPPAEGFLDGQMTILEIFALILDKARRVQEGEREEVSLGELRHALRIGTNLENHLFYAGHLVELASLARLDGFELTDTQSNAVTFVLNEINRTLSDWLIHLSFPDCFLSLGHYRRAATLWAALEEAQEAGQMLHRTDLQRYTVDFDAHPRPGSPPVPEPVLPGAVYEVVRTEPKLRDAFAAVLAAYTQSAPPEPLRARGQLDHFRRIGPSRWPRTVHYELLDHGSAIGAEVHLEHDEVLPLRPMLRDLTDRVRPLFPEARVVWDDRWYKGRGRLVVHFQDGIDAEVVAQAARTLIDATFDDIDRAIETHGLGTNASQQALTRG